MRVAEDGSWLSVELGSGTARFHAIWLRDNSLHPETHSAVNGQRLISLLDQDANVTIADAQLKEDSLRLRFSDQAIEHSFPLSWLESHRYDVPLKNEQGWRSADLQCWDSVLQTNIPTATFTAIRDDDHALREWLSAVCRFGFAKVTGLPDDLDGLLRVVDLFGFVRETNYGRYFEVRSEPDPINLAYTNQGLQAHTDNPYRDPVPTLQLLSCIENTTEGGESIVVDGFNAALVLKKEAPESFDLLSQYCARFQFAGGNDVKLQTKHPMIQLGQDGELIAVRFNNRSAAPFTDIPFDRMEAYYQAYRHFAEIVEREQGQVSFKLQPGELFIVDNTRVLHSRRAFSGAGLRWLRGCYADKDGLLSTLACLEAPTKDGSGEGMA